MIDQCHSETDIVNYILLYVIVINFKILPILPLPDMPVGGRLAHFMEKWEELMQIKWVLSIVRDSFRIPFNSTPPLSTVPISLSQSFSPLLRENVAPPEKDSGKGTRSGKSRFLFLDISYLEKELSYDL